MLTAAQGQLGTGDTMRCEVPTRIDAFGTEQRIVRIAGGSNFSVPPAIPISLFDLCTGAALLLLLLRRLCVSGVHRR